MFKLMGKDIKCNLGTQTILILTYAASFMGHRQTMQVLVRRQEACCNDQVLHCWHAQYCI